MTIPTADEASDTKEGEKAADQDNSWPGLALALLAGITAGCLLGSLGVLLTFSAAGEPAPSTTSRTSSAAPVPHPNQAQAWFHDQPNDIVCYTAACAETAKELRDSINPVVSPCDHFQEYVCGRRRFEHDTTFAEQQYDMITRLSEKNIKLFSASALLPMDAHHKAAYLLHSCIKRFIGPEVLSENVLQEFVRNEKLHLTGPPADVATGPAGVLALHVHLSFDYMLGGLLRILPIAAYVAASAAEALVHAAGFGKAGIRGSSPAAWWQARWRGPGVTNDFFAKLQSWGALGFPSHYNIYFGLIGFLWVMLIADSDDDSDEMLPPERFRR
ncbi:uncharacterized protein [Dermacentor albipictus]|uniref:uncharacterized protein n=1 Tax=Dermacentor albipictus TaxID=60249 RepID=UPI0038FD33E8